MYDFDDSFTVQLAKIMRTMTLRVQLAGGQSSNTAASPALISRPVKAAEIISLYISVPFHGQFYASGL